MCVLWLRFRPFCLALFFFSSFSNESSRILLFSVRPKCDVFFRYTICCKLYIYIHLKMINAVQSGVSCDRQCWLACVLCIEFWHDGNTVCMWCCWVRAAASTNVPICMLITYESVILQPNGRLMNDNKQTPVTLSLSLSLSERSLSLSFYMMCLPRTT